MAYSKSTDATVDVDTTPVQDDIMSIINNHFQPQTDVQLVAAMALGTTLLRSRIVTPTLRQVSSPYIRPVNHANLPITLPGVADYRHNTLTLKALEEIQVLTTQSAAGPTVVNVGLLVADQPVTPAPNGNIVTMRGTGATTVTANAWTSCPITWADTLPAGRYACVGLQAAGATAILSRMVFNGQFFRPGCLAQTNVWDNGHPMFRMGNIGVFGYFDSTRMPTIQFLCDSADTSQEVYMDIVRIG